VGLGVESGPVVGVVVELCFGDVGGVVGCGEGQDGRGVEDG
jgi:hypothetical protein